jgi:glyoxylase-like metal-dependent hydrolase (beta-lactamase superfamily II)
MKQRVLVSVNRWAGIVVVAMAAAWPPGAGPVSAQSAAVTGPRLYVFHCGTLKQRDPATYNLAPNQVESNDMSDPCFLVVHPKGSLLWETGLNDATFNKPQGGDPRGDKVDRSLKSQLAEIGYAPERITYLAISHSHGDHSGNVGDYAGSTWIVQKPEHESMFRGGAVAGANSNSFALLKNSKTIIIEGDHDVFGDGTVVLKSTPGHTPGHQSLFVRLAKTGPLVLSGDLYHFPAERTLKKMPTGEATRGQTGASREALEAFIRENRATLWIQHDIIGYARLKLSPAYYD